MAVLMMALNNSSSSINNNSNTNNEPNPIFHDFLGMSCASDSPLLVAPKTSVFVGDIRASEPYALASASFGASSGAHGHISAATSDLGSERQVGNQFEGFSYPGSKSDFSGPEISNRFFRRKRCNSDSMFVRPTRDRMPQTGPGSLESFHLMKILQNGGGDEQPRWSHDEERFFGMQPLRPTSSSITLQPPIGSRPDSLISKWERPMTMKAGSMVQLPHLLNQITPFMDKVSATKCKGANAGPLQVSQPAADESSRTGIKGGSGILSVFNANGETSEKNSSRVLRSSIRGKVGPHIVDPESSNPMSGHGFTSATRQMTIFYAGQAHVFDDVHPKKADMIMTLAGSNGASWSTTYNPKSSVQMPHAEIIPPNGGE